jgi:phosphatidate phosphatase APP1
MKISDFTKDGVYDVTVKGTLEEYTNVKVAKDVKGKLTIKNGVPVECHR